MSSVPCQLAAMTSVYFMRRFGFKPQTILNVGVGSTAPEIDMWKWLMPDAKLLGIDPRWSPRGNWTRRHRAEQLPVGVGAPGITGAQYCGQCRSIKCQKPEHGKQNVPMTTLDDIAVRYPASPYFVWMDIDGGEPDAIIGAAETLKLTGLANIECDVHRFGQAHSDLIGNLMYRNGFRLAHVHGAGSCDKLFVNRPLCRSLGNMWE